MNPRRLLAVLFLALAVPTTALDDDWIWWEGEDPVATNFPDRTWFSETTFEDTRHDILSGGAWLTNAGERTGEEAFARYEVDVPRAGEYSLWVRKFWKHGPFRWRFDGADWRVCGRDIGLADSVEIREHLCVNWVSLGRVDLAKGKHEFELRLLAQEGEALTACFDCFLLTPGPFLPRGRLRPGEASGKGEEGWWALEPPPDPFGKALLDLRHLNEDTAGTHGFVTRRTEDPAGFLLGDGTSVRFWAVNCGPGIVNLDRGSVDYLVRRLAKVGVNLVRIHGAIHDDAAEDPSSVDRAYLDRLHYFIAACKREGIYSALSFYFPLWVRVRDAHGIDGYEASSNRHPFGLIFHDARLQELYFGWARTLLTTTNPYTDVPLAEEPAVAMVELVNEDSYLFWTFNPGETIPLAQMGPLEREFGNWLVARHGSLAEAFAHWEGVRRERDDEEAGRVELLTAWHMTGAGSGEGGFRRRMSDQVRFLTARMRRFYDEAIERLRGMGCASLIVCGNWKTADPRVLDPLDRHACTAGDVLDQHGYFGGRHEGEGAAYSVRVGHEFEDRSCLFEPTALPLVGSQVTGFPQIVSEVGWPNPNRYRTEFPFLCATYGALQGIDGLVLFAINGPGWSAAAEKFQLNVPSVLGQFPACALLYRRGLVPEAKVVVDETLSLEALCDLEGAALAQAPELDALREGDVPQSEGTDATASTVDPLAFFVGRIQRSFSAKTDLALAKDLAKRIDRDEHCVRSADGALAWWYERGLVVLDTPFAKGFCGFPDDKLLAEVGIECGNDYAALLIVSLDDKPLSKSDAVLIQAATEDRPFRWHTEQDRITNLGGPPLLIRNLDAQVTIEGGARLSRVHALDIHGYGQEEVTSRKRGRHREVVLPPDAPYVILRPRR